MCISDCSMLALYSGAVYTINIHNLIHKYAQIHNIHIKQLNTIYTYFSQYIVYTQYAWCGRQRLWAVRVDLAGIEISAGTNFMMICNTGDFALSSNNWYNPRGRLGGPSHMAATDDDDHHIFLYRALESFHFYPAWMQMKHMHNKQLVQPSTTFLVQTIHHNLIVLKIVKFCKVRKKLGKSWKKLKKLKNVEKGLKKYEEKLKKVGKK